MGKEEHFFLIFTHHRGNTFLSTCVLRFLVYCGAFCFVFVFLMVDGNINSFQPCMSSSFLPVSFLQFLPQYETIFSHVLTRIQLKTHGDSMKFSGSLLWSFLLSTKLTPSQANSSLVLYLLNSSYHGLPEFSSLYLQLREADRLSLNLPTLLCGVKNLSIDSLPVSCYSHPV